MLKFWDELREVKGGSIHETCWMYRGHVIGVIRFDFGSFEVFNARVDEVMERGLDRLGVMDFIMQMFGGRHESQNNYRQSSS